MSPSSSSSSFPFSRIKHSKSGKRMARKENGRLNLMISLALLGLVALLAGMQVDGGVPKVLGFGDLRDSTTKHQQPDHRQRLLRRLDSLKASLAATTATSPSPSPVGSSVAPVTTSSRVYHATDYGADPTGKTDSTSALMRAIDDAFKAPGGRHLMPGITNLGGAELHLDGGSYSVSSPIKLPASKGGNFKIHSGSLIASDDFPTGRFLIELWANPSSESQSTQDVASMDVTSSDGYDYEYITIRDVLLDANFRCGGIAVVNSLRTTINNCYITHFQTTGIWVKDGHETYISTSYLGQHITAGNDPDEKSFSGTGIKLIGNDNAVTDVVIFSAETGILIAGQANVLTGVHCYNKATGFGGTGIYLKLPGLTQTRIVNCYLDFNGIVSEDPVQLHVSNCFFLGGGNIVLKSVNGKMSGVNIVDNMFSGGGNGVDIVKLDESNGPFKDIKQVIVHRNNADGMRLKTTVAKATVSGNGTVWTVDFSPVLLFQDRIEHVQYTLRTGSAFPNHALRNVSENRVVIESENAVNARIDVSVDQSVGNSISIT